MAKRKRKDPRNKGITRIDSGIAHPTKPKGRRIAYRDVRNTTGVLGVCRTRQKRPSGNIYEIYSVSWRPAPGVLKVTSFSIRKYGEKKAFKLAVAHRRKMLREIYGPGIFLKIAARQKGS